MRKVRWVAYGLVGVALLAWGAMWVQRGGLNGLGTASVGVAVPGGVSVGGPFTLVGADGKTVTAADFKGRFMLVYFGYTFCPDVCPTELQMVANALDLLGKSADRVAPIFITVDPARDTPKVVGEYVKLFSPRLIGLTGSEAQVAAAAKTFRVYYAKASSADATSYLMDHSSFIYLMDANGKFSALFSQGTTAQQLADGIKAKLAGAS
jgi:cytochrome oxidase Cu insertion factor (SCO1/SenC/PrrC family)